MRKLLVFYLLLITITLQANKQQLTVGIRPNFPPYEFTSNGRIIGFNIDILNQLSDLFSYDINYIQAEDEELRRMLDSGKIDMLSFCFQSQENKSTYNLSIPYNMVAFGIYTPFQSSIQRARDIMPYKVSLQNELLYQLIKKNKNFAGHLILRRNQNQCLKDINSGDADAAIIGTLSGKYLIEKHNYKMIKVPPINFRNLQYSFAFDKSNDSLLVQFNEGLNILRETGTYNRIYQKWFGEVHPKQIKETQKAIYWPYYILAAIIILLLVLFYNQRKRYLNLKTLKQTEIQIRHHAEQALHEQKKLTNMLVDNLEHIIVIRSKDKKIKIANRAFAKLIGKKKEEIINHKLNEAVITNTGVLSMLSEHEGEDHYTFKTRVTEPQSGTAQTFEVNHIKISNDEKEDVFCIIAINITQRENYEQMLKHEKALLTSLVNSIPDPIFYKNRDMQYIGGNGAFKALNGFADNSDFIGKTDYDLYDKETADKYQKADKNILTNKKSINYRGWSESIEGHNILYDTLKVPIIDQNGELRGIVGISRDITREAKIQQQLEHARDKAEESDNLKTTFLTNLSHEIRTPLNSIIGFSDLLTDPDLTDDQREEFTELISRSGNALLMLVDDIIDLSKIEAGQVQINRSKFDLNRLIIDVHEAIEDNRDFADKNAVLLEYYIPINEEEAFLIETDDFRLRQILSNLIKNALKYTNRGEVKFGYRLGDEKLTFFIKDTGLGIPEEQKSNIFERYNQSESVEKFGGSGLGLSISKKLVELLGGEIGFNTDEEKGSEFYFTLPFETPLEEAKPNPKTALANEYNWTDKQILVAEDEQNNYVFIEEALKKTGAKIIWATDGQQAVEVVKGNPEINLVLMDIKMPNLDGYEATKIIKKMRADLPVIAQTAYAMSDERDLSMQAGCDEYLTKPIRPKKLLRKINQLL